MSIRRTKGICTAFLSALKGWGEGSEPDGDRPLGAKIAALIAPKIASKQKILNVERQSVVVTKYAPSGK
jgi:hypothetical protein